MRYILIEEGDHFGDIDIVLENGYRSIKCEEEDFEEPIAHDFQKIYRKFTVQAVE
jgi:hypothetical protein